MFPEIINETQGALYLSASGRPGPFLDMKDFPWIRCDTIPTDSEAKQINGFLCEVTFVRVEDQVDLS